MRIALEQMRENFQLQDRVEMLGHVNHSDVRDVLTRGHIYLNCSLTEAFCIAILEAASCGLLVVSTKVGGVPEVLPSHMIKYARPDPREMVDVLAHAILHQCKDVNPQRFHDEVKRIYSWHDVTHRTCKVLSSALRLAWRAVPPSQRSSPLFFCPGLRSGRHGAAERPHGTAPAVIRARTGTLCAPSARVRDRRQPQVCCLTRLQNQQNENTEQVFGILIAFLVAIDHLVWQLMSPPPAQTPQSTRDLTA